jgi:hypothetical protein
MTDNSDVKERYTVNPLAKGRVRNLPCLCGSGLKVKKCCADLPFVPESLAKLLNEQIERLEAER